jgi:transcriptional regulator with XRE-family HTH domain
VKRGLSQEGLAADAGVDWAYLGGLEREQENPTIAVLDRLAAAPETDVGAKRPGTLPAGRRKD